MKTFNERSNDSRIVFGGMYSNFHPLSNYYACPITFKKQKYRSLEQAYQHCKSTFFGQAESAHVTPLNAYQNRIQQTKHHNDLQTYTHYLFNVTL